MSTAGPTSPAQPPLGEAPLSPAQRSKIRRLAMHKDPDPGEEAGELNIIPYLDIIVNVLVFVLASVAVTFLTQLDTQPPSIGGKGVKESIKSEALNLAIVIVDDGVSFKTSFGQIAPGCSGVGKGITVPTIGNTKFEYDLPEIKRCAREMKKAGGGERFADETQVTVTASRNIEYRHLIAVLDALRGDAEGELFPEFHLGVTK
jgi:biopolymer transport protein TolR